MDSDSITRAFPARIADLGFSVRLPRSWQAQPLPDDTPAFDDPRHLVGLAAATAPYAAVVFAAAARPAFEQGTVRDWALWLVQQDDGVQLQAQGPSQLGTLPAIVGQCSTVSELGEMLTFFACAEDGGRLLHTSLTGPAVLQAHVLAVWQDILASFALDAPQGATVPLAPTPEVHQPPPGTHTTVADVGQFALPGGLATLQADHPINQRLLQQGQGFTPPLRAVDEDSGKAWVASMALQAVLELPLGWHPLDDSRRLLLLDPSNEVQISLQRLRAPAGAGDHSLDALLDHIEAQTRQDVAAPQVLRLRSGPMLALAVRGLFDGDQPLEQLHLLVAAPGEDPHDPAGAWAVRARVTATPQRMRDAGDLGEALLHSLRHALDPATTPATTPAAEAPAAAAPTQATDGLPAWAQQARALEAAGRLTEAEQVMRAGCNHLGVLMSIAEMYRRHMQRQAAAGDTAGAAQARARAVDRAWAYAAGATSGGEGAALSRERDAFIAQLGPA